MCNFQSVSDDSIWKLARKNMLELNSIYHYVDTRSSAAAAYFHNSNFFNCNTLAFIFIYTVYIYNSTTLTLKFSNTTQSTKSSVT